MRGRNPVVGSSIGNTCADASMWAQRKARPPHPEAHEGAWVSRPREQFMTGRSAFWISFQPQADSPPKCDVPNTDCCPATRHPDIKPGKAGPRETARSSPRPCPKIPEPACVTNVRYFHPPSVAAFARLLLVAQIRSCRSRRQSQPFRTSGARDCAWCPTSRKWPRRHH